MADGLSERKQSVADVVGATVAAQGVRERVRMVEAAPNEPYDHARYVVEREPWPADERARVERIHAETEAVVWPGTAAG